jgi:hypothetical protein
MEYLVAKLKPLIRRYDTAEVARSVGWSIPVLRRRLEVFGNGSAKHGNGAATSKKLKA